MNRTIASSTSRSTPLGRIRCANPATWSSTNPAAARLSAIVGAGDPPGPPRRQVTGPDPGPGPGEPVPQLEGLTEVGLAGLGGQPDRGRELGHTELRDQRRTLSGDRDRGVAEPDRVTDRLRRVQVRPRAGGPEQVGLGGVRGGAPVPGEREHPGGGVRAVSRLVAAAGSWPHSSRTGVRDQGWNPSALPVNMGDPKDGRRGLERVAAQPPQPPPEPPPGHLREHRAASLRRCALSTPDARTTGYLVKWKNGRPVPGGVPAPYMARQATRSERFERPIQ